MEYAYLVVSLANDQGNLVGNQPYYYKLPVYETSNGVQTAMTEQRARDLFILDGERQLKLLTSLPTDGCVAYVKIGDLRIPIPSPLSAIVSVLRVNHSLRVGENFEILAELKDWSLDDKAYVEIVGLNGTSVAYSGKYVMSPLVQVFPAGSTATYSWHRLFDALKAGDQIEYRVHAGDQAAYVAGKIVVENTDPVHGPVWGAWAPKIVQVGADYSDQVPLNAATGTGTLNYFLIDAPAWYRYAQNTRNIVSIAPGSVPTLPEKVTYRANDDNGQTDKTFTLQYATALDMVAGWGWELLPSVSRTTIGMGPNDDQPYTTKLSVMAGGTGFADSSVHTAERVGVGLDGVMYPWRSVYDNLPAGIYQAEITRSNGQKKYAQLTINGVQRGYTLQLSPSPAPVSTTGSASPDGPDVWTNTGLSDGSLNDNVVGPLKTLTGLTPGDQNSLVEGNALQLRLVAGYSDGSVVNVIADSSMSVSGGGASISASGVLTAAANSVAGDTHTVLITFQYGGLTTTYTVTIIDATVAPTVKNIAWQGPDRAPEGIDTPYHIIASFTDNTTADVTVSAQKSGGTNGTMGQDGLLHTPANLYLDDDRTTTLSASYGGKNATKEVAITDATPLSVVSVMAKLLRGNLCIFVKTSPNHISTAYKNRSVYFRLKVDGGGVPAIAQWRPWNGIYSLQDNKPVAGQTPDSTVNDPSLALQEYYLMDYGLYYNQAGDAYTAHYEFCFSADGSGPVFSAQYTVPHFTDNQATAAVPIYPV